MRERGSKLGDDPRNQIRRKTHTNLSDELDFDTNVLYHLAWLHLDVNLRANTRQNE